MPLHLLCLNRDLDHEARLKMLKLLIMKYPESVKHTAGEIGMLPIHLAAGIQSPEFCQVLIEDYPGSERTTTDNLGILPFHVACANNTIDTVEYLYDLYPESINVVDDGGLHPFHHAIRRSPEDGIDIITFLLDCNPDALSSSGQTLLHIVCGDKKFTLGMVQIL